MFFCWGLPFLVLVVCGAAGPSACVQCALRQRGDGVLLSALEGVMRAVDKKISMLGIVTRVISCGPGTRPERWS